MENSSKPKIWAVGLIQTPHLRQQVSDLCPAYTFYWDLDLTNPVQVAADLRPAFLLAELDVQSDWREITLALQNSPATRRIPMLAISQTATPALMQVAASVSLLGPFSHDMLAEHLPPWVSRHARVWDADYYAALAEYCAQPLPPLAQEGIHLFNLQEFWEAHEVLEQAWMAVRPHPIGEVYRSILQVGVAYYQIQKGNYRGAMKMFLRAVQWLDPLPETCQGVNVAQFKQDAAAARAELERVGAERIHEFDQSLFKPVPLI